jgi:hypothetical protein
MTVYGCARARRYPPRNYYFSILIMRVVIAPQFLQV